MGFLRATSCLFLFTFVRRRRWRFIGSGFVYIILYLPKDIVFCRFRVFFYLLKFCNLCSLLHLFKYRCVQVNLLSLDDGDVFFSIWDLIRDDMTIFIFSLINKVIF